MELVDILIHCCCIEQIVEIRYVVETLITLKLCPDSVASGNFKCMSYPGLLDDCKDHILLCTHLEDSKLKLKTHYWANYARLILVPITAQSSTSSISAHLPQSQLHLYSQGLKLTNCHN